MAQAGLWGGDALHGKAVVTKLVPRSPRNGIVEITIEVYNQKGVHVLSNVTEADVKCAPAEVDSGRAVERDKSCLEGFAEP